MLETILKAFTPYASIISAGSAFISAIAVLISTVFITMTFFRKTRRDRIDDLKVEMQELFTKDFVRKKYLEISPEEFFGLLKPKFKTQKYKTLHRCAYDELTYEGKNWIVNSRIKYEQGVAARANVSNPM